MLKKSWPELLVLFLFLLGDILWDGFAAALAGVAAGIIAFVILFFLKKKKPQLIIEGLLFGGVTALGEVIDYPGGNLILMELVFGIILLGSAIAGKNIISKLTGELGKGLFSEQQSGILSTSLGLIFLIHSGICTFLHYHGYLTWWIGGGSFLVVYMLIFRISKTKMRSAEENSLPVLLEEGHGIYRLEISGCIAGKIKLTGETGTAVTAEIISIESTSYELLKQLESAMKRRHMRSISIECWVWDEIELEMQGYVCIHNTWRKRL